jgi:uncharacterized protein YjbJ (UPF0337 family)
MNWERLAGNWKRVQGKARQRWGKLTADEFEIVAGGRDELIGRVQARYGVAHDAAERRVDNWLESVGNDR